MPTYMIGTCNENVTVDELMACGNICAENLVALDLKANHRKVANTVTLVRHRQIGDAATLYFFILTKNNVTLFWIAKNGVTFWKTEKEKFPDS